MSPGGAVMGRVRQFVRPRRGAAGGRTAALLVLLALLGLRAADPPWLEGLRHRVFDAYQQAKPRDYQRVPVAIVDIDEASLEALGQWPWPRNLMADIVRRTQEAGAAVIGFDVIFAEPDRLSPSRILAGTGTVGAADWPGHDEAFAATMATMPVVLGRSGALRDRRGQTSDTLPQTAAVLIGPPPMDAVTSYDGTLANIPPLETAATGRGLLSFLPDLDGVLRRYPAVSAVGDALAPSFGLELLRVALGQDAFIVRTDDTGGVSSVSVGPFVIPTDRNGRLYIRFTDHRPERFVSAADLLAGRLPEGRLAGHVVLVGTSATSLADVKATPLGTSLPGVEIHAQFMESVLTRQSLLHPSYAAGMELALTAALGLLIILLLPRLGAMPAAMLVAAIVALLAGGSWWLFAERRVLVDATAPGVTALLVFVVLAVDSHRQEEEARRRVRGAFQQYLSPALVEQLTREPERLVLGGESRTMTILFSDVRGFTTLSETFKGDAPGLTRLMNRLMTPLTNAILERQGTIDKYMGDAIMAFWNAPLDVDDHAGRACEAALEMMARLAALNRTFAEEARSQGRGTADVAIGIGINTGEVVVGNMGSDLRFDYTVLGDAVNLASRLEGQSKAYHVNIIVGGETVRQAGGRFAFLELDLIRVKGKREPERIFALMGDGSVAVRPDFRHVAERLLAAHAAIRAQDWDGALAGLATLHKEADTFGLRGYLAMLRERVEGYVAEPPGPDWDGVHVATSK